MQQNSTTLKNANESSDDVGDVITIRSQSIISQSKNECNIFISNIINNSNDKNEVRNDEELPKGTIIKVGDTIITGITEE